MRSNNRKTPKAASTAEPEQKRFIAVSFKDIEPADLRMAKLPNPYCTSVWIELTTKFGSGYSLMHYYAPTEDMPEEPLKSAMPSRLLFLGQNVGVQTFEEAVKYLISATNDCLRVNGNPDYRNTKACQTIYPNEMYIPQAGVGSISDISKLIRCYQRAYSGVEITNVTIEDITEKAISEIGLPIEKAVFPRTIPIQY